MFIKVLTLCCSTSEYLSFRGVAVRIGIHKQKFIIKQLFFFPDCICLAIAKVSFLHLSLLLTSVLITSHGVAWVAGQRPVWPQKQAILHPLHGPRGPQHFTLQQSRGSSPHGHVPRLGPERLLPTHACTGQKGESDSDERVETTIKCILSIQRILYCNEFS